jgi:hypothetical protein
MDLNDCLEVFNKFTPVNGTVAIARPIVVSLPSLDGEFDGEW